MKGKHVFLFVMISMMLRIMGELYGAEPDGVIDEGEYDHQYLFQEGGLKLYMKVEAPLLSIGMEAPTTGWVAVGFDPVSVMDQADMVIGWVDSSGKAYALDCFSTGMFGPHPPDTDLGGTNDVVAFGGSERTGKTVVEFQRPIETSDTYDKSLDPARPLQIIWAYGETDKFDDMHIAAGSAEIDLQSGQAASKPGGRYLLFHILFMGTALILISVGVGIARFLRKKKWWLKVHRLLGILSALSAGLGLGAIVLFVENTRARHFAVPHAWIGLAAMAGAFLVPVLGQAFLRLKWKKQEIRFFHRWGGRTTVLLMGIAALMGLSLLGVF